MVMRLRPRPRVVIAQDDDSWAASTRRVPLLGCHIRPNGDNTPESCIICQTDLAMNVCGGLPPAGRFESRKPFPLADEPAEASTLRLPERGVIAPLPNPGGIAPLPKPGGMLAWERRRPAFDGESKSDFNLNDDAAQTPR